MSKRKQASIQIFFVCLAAMAMTPAPGATIEKLCSDRGGRSDDAWVRVSWTDVETSFDDVRISYCVLRGNHDASLTFERDAEIVYFALANVERKAERRPYTFVIKTSQGKTLRQGPAQLQPVARQPVTCRVDVCQFFTDPGERVISVSVEAGQSIRRS
jgi:hypothetical protein